MHRETIPWRIAASFCLSSSLLESLGGGKTFSRPKALVDRDGGSGGCLRHGTALGGTRSPTQFAIGVAGRERKRRFFERWTRKLNVTGETFRGRAKPSLSRRDATRTYTSAHKSAVRTERPPSPSTATSTPAGPTCCKRPSESWLCAATDLTRVTSRRYRGKYWPRANRPRQLREIAGSPRGKAAPYRCTGLSWDHLQSYSVDYNPN